MNLQDIVEERNAFQRDANPYRQKMEGGSNTFGGYITADGVYHRFGPYVCTGWMHTYNFSATLSILPEGGGRKVVFLLSAVMSSVGTQKQTVAYIDWLINRSPWAEIFVDKDAKQVFALGYVIDTTKPANLIGNALIACRLFTESYVAGAKFRVKTYLELLELGCSEQEALLFSQMYAPSERGYPYTFSRFSSGHAVFTASGADQTYYQNFLRSTPANLTESFQDLQGYECGTINSTWGTTTGNDTFANKVKSLHPIRAEKKKDLNIFRKETREAFSYGNKQDFLSVIQQLRELINA